MDLIRYFFRQYPARTIYVLLALMLAGVIEGISVGALLPLIGIAANQASDQQATSTDIGGFNFDHLFDFLGLHPTVENILVFIVIGIFIKSLVSFGSKYFAGGTAVKVSRDLRLALLDAISKAQWTHFVSQPAGKVSSSLIIEASRAADGYMISVNLTTSLIQIIVYLGIALLISWQMALASIALGLIMLFSLHELVLIAKKVGNKLTSVTRSIVIQLNDNFRSIKSLKAMALESNFNDYLTFYIKKLARVERRRILSSEGLTAAQEPVLIIGLAIGTYAAFKWLALPFGMIAVTLFALLRIVKTFGKAQKQYQGLVSQLSGFHGILETIETARAQREIYPGTVIINFQNSLSFDQVSFKHGNATILENCTAHFPRCGVISITGPSGTGKTTLIDLIAGLYQPDSGRITVDGISLAEVNIHSWRNQIGYVMQETTLISGSITDNVRLGNQDYTDDDVISALKKAHAWEFVEQLPDTISTIVGEQGGRLSGGQRQRILVARALVRNPRLLILDEATSALDKETELALSEVIRELGQHMLIISISHRPAIITVSDAVYALENHTLRRQEHKIVSRVTSSS